MWIVKMKWKRRGRKKRMNDNRINIIMRDWKRERDRRGRV